ncbi:hypothetical protein [Pseudomonas phage pPA-3099-2aT.2]|uniref:Uncharacterized protein n=1 Tax=Pseudomonas phage pPA-3099-2aT.2 TaxID=3003808 RepID=A0AAE9W6A8_9CAUD|nr:hypothetical protein QE325_gp140 [Pseudomonas phage pPA-3099-2aT.2]WBQ35241.1 hypothetical protein [Pseudomonas phage pPA-3099-2aT.2]
MMGLFDRVTVQLPLSCWSATCNVDVTRVYLCHAGVTVFHVNTLESSAFADRTKPAQGGL